MVHVVIATLGIGIVLRLYPLAFNAMLLAGALYIAWIGASLWRGALTCLMNPKAYVFMLAIFPQFIRTDHGALRLQAVVLWTGWQGLQLTSHTPAANASNASSGSGRLNR